MGQFREPPTRTRIRTTSIVATDAMFETWEVLRRHLQSRGSALAEEVRHYPTPIARCDEQLTKLLEQRAHVLKQLKRMVGEDAEDRAHPGRPSLLSVQALVDSYDPSDDETEMDMVSRLRASLSALRGRTSAP